MNTRSVGFSGEEQAAQHLLLKGYEIIHRNFGTGQGEIDLIAKSPDGTIVFVEVKKVTTLNRGDPGWRISPSKIATIRKVATQFLLEHKLQEVPVQIDAVTITPTEISHIKNCQ